MLLEGRTMTAPTLNETLRALGMTTRPAGLGTKDIISGALVLLTNARAQEVWDWLRETGRIS